ncbi:MAG: hypothetical protein M1829_003707 [Trizodia sp. TS-e1964]|nr:MAG: hypothetical protein M1829_003707 [Trizodia sp. TS-e1964]
MTVIFEDQILNHYSDDDLEKFILRSSPISSRVFCLSSTLVAKQVSPPEASGEVAAMKLAKQLGIRVASIKKILERTRLTYIIMDRIAGSNLEEVWAQKSWFESLGLAFQLNRYILTMRSLVFPTVGTLDKGRCHSIWLEDYYRLPESSKPEAIESFFKFWLQFKAPQNQLILPLPSNPTPLVFTHKISLPETFSSIMMDTFG